MPFKTNFASVLEYQIQFKKSLAKIKESVLKKNAKGERLHKQFKKNKKMNNAEWKCHL